jgi:hypothetical protein
MFVAVVLLALATGCTAAVPIAEGHVSLDGRRLELLLDACNADTQLQVDDSADMVAVQVRRHDVVTSRIASGACQDIAYVDLERPLGDRPVVDRSDDRRLPVSRPAAGRRARSRRTRSKSASVSTSTRWPDSRTAELEGHFSSDANRVCSRPAPVQPPFMHY